MTSTANRPQLDSPSVTHVSPSMTHASPSVTHVERVPARPGVFAEWPAWAPSEVVSAFGARGITEEKRKGAERDRDEE